MTTKKEIKELLNKKLKEIRTIIMIDGKKCHIYIGRSPVDSRMTYYVVYYKGYKKRCDYKKDLIDYLHRIMNGGSPGIV